jgi:hypothetical protein
VLRKCKKVDALRQTLETLPETLDETYERILSNIGNLDRDDAYRIFQWLAFSAHPMTLAEINAGLAIDVKNGCLFSKDGQLRDPHDILAICSTLITIGDGGMFNDLIETFIVDTNLSYRYPQICSFFSERISNLHSNPRESCTVPACEETSRHMYITCMCNLLVTI